MSTPLNAVYAILHLLSLLPPPSQYVLFTLYSFKILSRIKLHPNAIGVGLSSPLLHFLLLSSRSLSWSLKRDTLLEMATRV